jgi:CCR4-NOT transcription complex subunit 6
MIQMVGGFQYSICANFQHVFSSIYYLPNFFILDKITVFGYNILCERLATASQYGYTPSWALSWEYRRELLVPEIVGWGADIICLQEVELGEYENYLRDDLKKLGDYNGAFWPKSRAKTMGEKERMMVDGCAIFFRSSK